MDSYAASGKKILFSLKPSIMLGLKAGYSMQIAYLRSMRTIHKKKRCD